jgi:hypothetical protein
MRLSIQKGAVRALVKEKPRMMWPFQQVSRSIACYQSNIPIPDSSRPISSVLKNDQVDLHVDVQADCQVES